MNWPDGVPGPSIYVGAGTVSLWRLLRSSAWDCLIFTHLRSHDDTTKVPTTGALIADDPAMWNAIRCMAMQIEYGSV